MRKVAVLIGLWRKFRAKKDVIFNEIDIKHLTEYCMSACDIMSRAK